MVWFVLCLKIYQIFADIFFTVTKFLSSRSKNRDKSLGLNPENSVNTKTIRSTIHAVNRHRFKWFCTRIWILIKQPFLLLQMRPFSKNSSFNILIMLYNNLCWRFIPFNNFFQLTVVSFHALNSIHHLHSTRMIVERTAEWNDGALFFTHCQISKQKFVIITIEQLQTQLGINNSFYFLVVMSSRNAF